MKNQHTGGFLNPDKVIDQLNITHGMSVADFGCGHGYFSIPFARRVGNSGTVYACDVLPSALEAVETRANLENLSNIKTVRTNLENPEGSKLDPESMDLVCLANILFQSNKKEEIVKEAI